MIVDWGREGPTTMKIRGGEREAIMLTLSYVPVDVERCEMREYVVAILLECLR